MNSDLRTLIDELVNWRVPGPLLLLALFLATMQLPARGYSQQTGNTDGSFVVETVSGETFSGTGVQISEDRVFLAGPAPREFELGEIVAIGTGAESTEAQGTGQQILFVTGGGLRGDVVSVTATKLDFTFGNSPVSIGLEAVAGVIWTDSQETRNLLDHPSAESDQIVVQGADGNITVSGLFEGMTDTGLAIQYQGQSRAVDREKVQAILPARISVATREDVSATVTLVDGQSFRGRVFSMHENTIGVSIMQQKIVLPIGTVSMVTFASDRIQQLSELEPVEVSEEVLFAPARGWKRNQSVSGNPIRLFDPAGGGSKRLFRNGIGVQSRTVMVFSNEKGFDRFAVLVGIDLETGGRGDCQVSVRADGIELWSAHLEGGKPAIAVNVDIGGMQRIELIVEPGEQLDLSDHVDWADARFLRTR